MAEYQSNFPSLAELLAWLDRISAVHRARMLAEATATPNPLPDITDDLRLLRSLLLSQSSSGQAQRAVRLLLAQGALNWKIPQADVAVNVSPLIVQSLVSSALWPLIIVQDLPTGWEDALRDISSPEITQLVFSLRRAYNSARPGLLGRLIIRHPYHHTPEIREQTALKLTQELGEPSYSKPIFNLLEDLRDPDRGGVALNALIIARDGSELSTERDAVSLLRFLVAGAIGAAIQGVIGNRVDALVVDAWNQLKARISDADHQVTMPTNREPSIPITISDWRDELVRRNTKFGEMGGYWCYVKPGNYRVGGWDRAKRLWEEAQKGPIGTDIEPSTRDAIISLSKFWVSRFPVTVAQFTPFVSVGYQSNAERWWSSNGWQWKKGSNKERMEPRYWGNPKFNDPYQSVEVHWFEAAAFANWLTECLSDVLLPSYTIRLPTDAEWEVAAAYDKDGRRHLYPWGDEEPDASRAAYGVDLLSPLVRVGIHPAGAAACGALDMAGNVWELVTSGYWDYPERSNEPLHDFRSSGRTLRGSAHWVPPERLSCGERGMYLGHSYPVGFRLALTLCAKLA